MSEKLLCDFCGTEATNDSEFCTKCGTIFIDNVDCFIHPDDDAKGVCAICHQAYCKKCGLRVNGIFLCNEHSHYEIYEGMASVFGSSDEQKINYLKSITVRPSTASRGTGWNLYLSPDTANMPSKSLLLQT